MINLVTIVLSVGNNLLFLGGKRSRRVSLFKGKKKEGDGFEVRTSGWWIWNCALNLPKVIDRGRGNLSSLFIGLFWKKEERERERGGSRRGIFEVWEEIWSAIIDRIATKSINYKVILYGTESRGGRIFIKVFHRSIRHPMMQSTFPSIMQDVSYWKRVNRHCQNEIKCINKIGVPEC